MTARGPGRVNLIGEHTDYNHGLCLPFAVEQGVTITAEPGEPGMIEARALDLGEEDRFALTAVSGAEGWRAFVRGTAAELASAGVDLPGARLTIEGDLPRGAGLSSSAALGTALALALVTIAGAAEPDRRDLARLCSRVENDWVGAQTGLLDQLAALLCRKDHALWLDCRDLATEQVPLELGDWTLAVVDSGARHSTAKSGYNERRRECVAACRELGVESLREAEDEAAIRALPAPLDRRALHVLGENQRVRHAAEALRGRDLAGLARLLDASHASLRDLYEVSVPAVEQTVARTKRAGAAGARIMGGGFGGSVLALFAPGRRPPDDALEVTSGGPATVSAAGSTSGWHRSGPG